MAGMIHGIILCHKKVHVRYDLRILCHATLYDWYDLSVLCHTKVLFSVFVSFCFLSMSWSITLCRLSVPQGSAGGSFGVHSQKELYRIQSSPPRFRSDYVISPYPRVVFVCCLGKVPFDLKHKRQSCSTDIQHFYVGFAPRAPRDRL